MSDTKLDPRSLSSAVVREVFPPPPPLAGWVGFYWDSGFYDSEQGTNEDAGWYCSGKVHATREDALCELAGFRPFEGSALVEVGSALFGEPASGGGKVECPNCGGEAAYFDEHHDGYEFLCAPCKPAQPEPAKQDFGSLLDAQQRYVAEHRAQPAPAANSAQAINARAEAAFAEATRLKPVADGRNLVTAETHPDLFPWVKPHAQMRDEAVAEAINTEPVAAVYIDSPGGQRNRVLTDETDKPVAAEMPEAKRKHNPDLKLDFIAAGWAKTADGWIAPVDELPEAVRLAAYHLRTSASDYESRSRAGQIDILNECAKVQRDAADALESFWRTHAAQPAKAPPSHDVLMSILNSLATKTISVGKAQKILMQWATGEKVDDFAEANEEAVHSMMFGDDEQPAPAVAMTPAMDRDFDRLLAQLTCAGLCVQNANTSTAEVYQEIKKATVLATEIHQAVRSRAAEAGKVRMLQVRIALDTMRAHFEPDCQGGCQFPMVWDICRAALAELDAAEGRK